MSTQSGDDTAESAETPAPAESPARAGSPGTAQASDSTVPAESADSVESAEGTGSAESDAAESDSAESPEAAREARITAAGGVVVGESALAARADPSRVRRAPRYRRFAVLGGLLGLVIAAFITPLASTSEGVDTSDIFWILALILIPFGILVTCAVAMFTDRAARARRPRSR